MKQAKAFVLDTNVLLHSAESLLFDREIDQNTTDDPHNDHLQAFQIKEGAQRTKQFQQFLSHS